MTEPSAQVAVLSTPRSRSLVARSQLVRGLYARYHGQVYRLALRYGSGNTAWAEDITQDVFLRVIDIVDDLTDHDSLSAWFYRVTINRCLNRLRRDRLRESTPLRWILGRAHAPPDPEHSISTRQELTHAWAVLEQLPPAQRIAFSMYYLDGKAQIEIAETLGRSKGYVCKLIKRAEEAIRRAGWEIERVP